MATPKPLNHSQNIRPSTNGGLSRYLPFLDWLMHYRREHLVGDLMAGIIVAIMLAPQSMAYALLAGLPPQVGLYAGIVPLIIYGLLGSSRALAVGPVAIMSLLTTAGLSHMADPGSADYIALALMLALLLGLLQILMGIFRVGFLVNFLSHPVLVGFTGAAALVIGASQIKHIVGITMPNTESIFEMLFYIFEHRSETNLVTLVIGLTSVVMLFYFKDFLGAQLKRMSIAEALIVPLTRSGPLILVLLSILLVWRLRLDQTVGLKVVGTIPIGLPPLTLPTFDWARWQALLPTAVTLAFVGFMESISVAKSLASKRRQKVDADQELLALGLANVGAAFTGGYPVTGGFSRSVVNFTAGANTGLASMITATLLALTVLFLTPMFYFLPQAVLAAIVIVAVSTLIDVHTIQHVWYYNKADAAAWLITFLAVLSIGVETGIIVGVVATIVLYLWRTSRPHIAIVGRVGTTETYRNVLRYEVKTFPHIVAVRVDESLYFANTKYLEDTLLQIVAERPDVKHLLLIGSAINFIDFSALETLYSLWLELRDAGVQLYLTEIKGPVMDALKTSGFIEKIGAEHIFMSTHDAMTALELRI